ncbi:hypothetical protein CLOACE_22260 [Clostridium acetireducens DSM 10703]|uniref:Uncharacterized protein n=1 Tax=Clostridium acetireducens DSM 10703 TaxID=1121290 RepID=A0A1E8EVE2_9CLOT|nr:hypothetical protein [Clostridium acetireducens]OFH99474.1 hypothetical protein CLOACE_22260 [Clostridium acetireducens DSM 10703]
MSIQIYQNRDFKIYKAGDGFIVHNKHKNFKNGHTHVKKYSTCMVMIKLLERKQIPRSKSKYFIDSLIRLSSDKKYTKKIIKYTDSIKIA